MKNFKIISLIVLVSLLICSVSTAPQSAINHLTDNTGPWQILNNHLATILLGISFVDVQQGWVTGGQNGLGPIILKTTNAGQNWTNCEHSIQSMTFMDIAMSDAQHGICTGLGLGKVAEGTVYTTDGDNWILSETHTEVEAFQSAGAIDNHTVWQVGTWVSLQGSGNGVMISVDGGRTFSENSWPDLTEARYGSFLNSTTGWISGGLWPMSESQSESQSHPILKKSMWFGLDKFGQPIIKSPKEIKAGGGYQAVIAKTQDGGKNWDVQFSDLDAYFYFNEIAFTDEKNGWVVGEGTNSTTGAAAAYIWNSVDGGKTWNQQLFVDQGTMVGISMISAKEGWAVGGVVSPKPVGKIWHTTDGGKTWNDENTALSGLMPFNAAMLDSTHGYAVAVSTRGYCSTLVYRP
eukprot:TRINITY_DN2514_c0_g1_i1.p1 TRINITY_DN2514_c0_g1~~TRINITY_DN2514_c0_g1_i1.p1  ORF type:complete len:420 (+),score=238.97 TRINITY_DN2514_c0_g1_i1:47-1261(+)